MSEDLSYTLERLGQAACPEDVFGVLPGGREEQEAFLTTLFRQLARSVHWDRHDGSDQSQEAMRLLNEWREQAKQRIADGSYGHEAPPTSHTKITITSRTRSYTVGRLFTAGDLCDLYRCAFSEDGTPAQGLLKIVKNPRNNDLLEREGKVLRALHRKLSADPTEAKLRSHFPDIIESFVVSDAEGNRRQANVFRWQEGFFSLEEVLRAYPDGIHPADMAWMWNRVSAAMALAHSYGVIHGALTPSHMLIAPQDHNGMVVDWAYAVSQFPEGTEHIKAISPPYRAWYPPEVFEKKPPTPATDIYMSALTMIKLVGGDITSYEMPASVPREMQGFLKACVIRSPHRRPQDAWQVFDEFRALLQTLYGRPRFRHFAMPSK